MTSALSATLTASCDALGVELRIAEDHFVGIPIGKRFRDLGAFGVENLRAGADVILNPIENADAAAGLVAVAAEMHVVRIRPDHGDVLVLGRRAAKGFLILEEDERFACGFQRELLMLGTVRDFFGVVRIDIRIVEQPGEKFCAEHVRDGAINGSFGDRAVVHLLHETGIGVGKGNSMSTPASRAMRAAASLIRDDVVDANEFGDAEIIGDDDAVESPLVAQNVGKQMFVAVRRDAVDFVVGGHDSWT